MNYARQRLSEICTAPPPTMSDLRRLRIQARCQLADRARRARLERAREAATCFATALAACTQEELRQVPRLRLPLAVERIPRGSGIERTWDYCKEVGALITPAGVAGATGIRRGTVRRALFWLEARGFIRCTRERALGEGGLFRIYEVIA
jgi:hypothetical protein